MSADPSKADPAQTQLDEKTKVSTPQELIEEAQGLVRSLALKVHRSLPIPMDLDDLIAYGQLGLAEAAQKYSAESGVRFTTFAFYRVRGAIYDGVSKMNWTSRARLRRARFREMADDVIGEDSKPNEGGASPTAEDDADWLGRMTERLAVVYLASGDDDGDGDANVLAQASDQHEIPSKVVANREMQITLRKLVSDLPLDAKRLVTSIYFEGFSLTEAAERIGVSKSWASRIHAKSLDQLAQSLRRSGND